MMKRDMPKAYVPGEFEAQTYRRWEESGFFHPENLPGERNESFCIVMPPPNVTGTLHLGHAVMLAIEDLMIRFERMRGKKALWVPGTDHAAIATQTKVEKNLIKTTGKTRHDLGRDAFLELVRAFAKESHDTIVSQVKSMGSSCDWLREAYTLDEARSKAVRTMFKMMYDDGLIYRGTRVVNWDPEFQTTLADDEVETKDTTAKLYTFKYDAAFPIAISTTRPETKFGDTAVAVHPDDTRYAALVGKTFTATYCGKEISVQVIADAAVDPAFGTGALGVTPAHSKIDEDIARRHNLPSVQVIGKDGKMMASAGTVVSGMTTLAARAMAIEALRAGGVLLEEKEVAQALPISQRGGGVVEELPMLQWFIDVNKKIERLGGKSLKELSLLAVREGGVQIIPDRFEKVYFHWMENLRDWCISRQIWFGHQVPVWYRGEEMYVGIEAPKGEGWVQDPDSLDTWFSSGLWTFSTLGWPDAMGDLQTYHPTAVLETGYDILFFWVARMILMTTYAMGEVPFRHVYLHGLIRDEEGRKMSKSLGNVIDPLIMNEKYGTDATRLALVLGSTPGNDMKLSEAKIEGFRNFANKLWNISRFVLSQNGDVAAEVSAKTLADEWILAELSAITRQVTDDLAHFRFSGAGEALRDFTWSKFADWYLEVAKVQMKDAALLPTTLAILHSTLRTILKLWHPFMPFVTETIWQESGLSETEGMLMVAPWPVPMSLARDGAAFANVQELVTVLRNLRAEHKVQPGKKLVARMEKNSIVHSHELAIKMLAQLEAIEGLGGASGKVAKAVTSLGAVELVLEAEVDAAAERERLSKEIAALESYITSLGSRLENADFVARAPAAVVEKEKAKLLEAKGKCATLKGELEKLEP